MVQVESDADSTEPLAQKKTRAKKEAKRTAKTSTKQRRNSRRGTNAAQTTLVFEDNILVPRDLFSHRIRGTLAVFLTRDRHTT